MTAPATSSLRSAAAVRAAGSSFSVSKTTATPIGTLTRKIQCQLSASVSTPPSSTPRLPPPDITNPKMPIAFARSPGSVKRFIIKRQRYRGDDGAADPLHCARSDQQPLRRRHAASDRGDREERDADQEQAPVSEEIAEPPAEQQKAAEGEQIGIDDPGERRLGEAEVLPDRRQCDVHDRRVEDDHQVAQAEDIEREPAGSVVQGHDGFPFSTSFSSGFKR